jgi:hypothetical protein
MTNHHDMFNDMFHAMFTSHDMFTPSEHFANHPKGCCLSFSVDQGGTVCHPLQPHQPRWLFRRAVFELERTFLLASDCCKLAWPSGGDKRRAAHFARLVLAREGGSEGGRREGGREGGSEGGSEGGKEGQRGSRSSRRGIDCRLMLSGHLS